MSNTLKDKANYYKNHLKNEDTNTVTAHKSKHTISPQDVPKELKPTVDKLGYSYDAGLRHGNNRKMYADMKVSERKAARAKDKVEVQKELKKIKL